MVYLIQENLVVVSVLAIAAILVLMFCAAVLLAEQGIRHAYCARQKAAGMVSRLVPTVTAIPLKAAERRYSWIQSRAETANIAAFGAEQVKA